ncbi:hypothetical protein PR048_022542 [Dryococelus australis]|uniref:Uncharacterized protein n=1 Tax=Dryococelus australis TaxID=614101 RepID=A0ABQ9H1M1_9NEOP|nr:hypothetical protein PR048_022542 [Dryococelus australis]
MTNVWFQLQEFKRTSNWTTLHLSLESLLNNNSVAYRQLKTIGDGEPLVTSQMSACGYTQLISLLLCAGLDVNRQTNLTGDHWLFGTSLTGLVNIVNLLVSQGADVNMRDYTGYTPLMVAAQRGHLDVVKALVEAGANTTLRHSLGGNALEEAQVMNNAEVVEYLEHFPH